MTKRSRCFMPSFVASGLMFPKTSLRTFYHIWDWRPYWSCDLNAANNCRSPYPWRFHTKFCFDEKKMFEIMNGRTIDGRRSMVFYKLTYELLAQVNLKQYNTGCLMPSVFAANIVGSLSFLYDYYTKPQNKTQWSRKYI